jgi:hypothetical protein
MIYGLSPIPIDIVPDEMLLLSLNQSLLNESDASEDLMIRNKPDYVAERFNVCIIEVLRSFYAYPKRRSRSNRDALTCYVVLR